MTYLERITDLYRQMDEGRIFEAFDQYYHDDVVVIEPMGEDGTATRREGKAAQRKAIEEWMEMMTDIHDSGTEVLTSNEEAAVTTTVSYVDATCYGQRTLSREVGVQHWEGDKIIREEFFYFVPLEAQQQMLQSGQEPQPAGA